MRVALTGAPGTGKTTISALLEGHYNVQAVRDLADACGALGPAAPHADRPHEHRARPLLHAQGRQALLVGRRLHAVRVGALTG